MGPPGANRLNWQQLFMRLKRIQTLLQKNRDTRAIVQILENKLGPACIIEQVIGKMFGELKWKISDSKWLFEFFITRKDNI